MNCFKELCCSGKASSKAMLSGTQKGIGDYKNLEDVLKNNMFCSWKLCYIRICEQELL